jgi:exonuclease SbcC
MLPLNLEFRNFFSHRDSKLDFSQFSSALILGNVDGNYNISNGAGKSTIFDSLMWCLFNKSRVSSMDDVISWGENSCSVSLEFKHAESKYKIVRKRSRLTSTSSVEFFQEDAQLNWIDISDSTTSLTNAKIVSVIKFDYKTFINSAYFRQNDISEFTSADPSKKKEILKSIVDISKWDNYETKSKDEIRTLKLESSVLYASLDGYDDMVVKLEENKKDLDTLDENLIEKNKKRELSEEVLSDLSQKYSDLKKTLETDKWDKISEENIKISSDLLSSNKQLLEIGKNLSKLTKDYSEKQDVVNSLNSSISSSSVDEDAEAKIILLQKEELEFNILLNTSKATVENLEKEKFTPGQCYVCQQDVSNELYSYLEKKHDGGLDTNKKNITYSKNKLKEIESKIQALIVLKNNKKKVETQKNKIKILESEMSMMKNRIDELTTNSDSLSAKIKTFNEILDNNNKILDSLRNNDFKDLQSKINEMKEDLLKMAKDIEKDNRSAGSLTEKISATQEKINSLKASRKIYFEKQKRIGIYEKITRLFGKNGIQTILLNAVINDLEKTSNEILTSICNEPFIIYLDTQRKGSDGVSIVDTLDLRVKKEGITQDFSSLSEGEKFRVSLALRIALGEISSRHSGSSLDFLLLDEINSPLDRHGVESLFSNVIKSLEKKYKILVITHDDFLKEKFDNIIEVTKVNGESSITYISS